MIESVCANVVVAYNVPLARRSPSPFRERKWPFFNPLLLVGDREKNKDGFEKNLVLSVRVRVEGVMVCSPAYPGERHCHG